MSRNPTTPPEISSSEDTPPDSLLERLRKITGVTAPVPLPDKAQLKTEDGAPPVDRLIVVLRDCFAVLAAGGIAVAVVAAVGAIWLWGRSKAGAKRARQWGREMSVRVAAARARRAERVVQPAPVAPEIRNDEVREPVAASEAATAVPSLPSAPFVEPGQPGAGRRRVLQFFRRKPPVVPAAVAEATVEEPDTDNVAAAASFTVREAEPRIDDDVEESVGSPAEPVRARPARRSRPVVITAFGLLLTLPALWLVKPVRYYFMSLMGRGNAAVIIGSDGWLFPRVESEPPAAPQSLRETAAALQAQGAALSIVSVPAKSAVYPERLTGSGGGELQRQPHVAAALKDLTDAGALVLDLGPVLHGLKATDAAEGFVYSPQSALWSPRGMAQAAFAAASFIQQQPGYAALPLQPSLAVMTPATGAPTPEDLVTALDSPRLQSRYPAQSVPLIRLLTAAKKEPLASDAASPVTLLGGESVSLYDDPALGHPADGAAGGERSSAGFAQHLAWHLSTSLEVHTAGSSVAAAKDWLATRAEADRKTKRIIVWVLTDTDLLR